MDGTRTRLVALVGPLALAGVLGIAALLGQPGERAGTGPGVPAAFLPAPGPSALSTPSMPGLPYTTAPPASPEQARTGAAPSPEPAHTAGHR